MASDLCKQRLRKEFKQLITTPVENIRACPKETNILEWHYVIQEHPIPEYASANDHF